MSDERVTLQPADGARLDYVETLLERNGLPARDVRDAPARFYVACDATGDRVGVGGVAAHGDVGLLRSVAVEESARGRGVGTALVAALETEARAAGVGTLYLLTTTATDFFAALGYEAAERSDAPPVIRRTTEFDALCPDSATCMRRSL